MSNMTNLRSGLEPLHGGKRFGLTKAQKKSCCSFRELTEKMNNESKHEFMVFCSVVVVVTCL